MAVAGHERRSLVFFSRSSWFSGPAVGILGGTAAAASNCQTYSSPSTGSHNVCGAILVKYQTLGGPSSFLGYPTTDELGTADGVGRYSDFANGGAIYWTPQTGAWSIHGDILGRWLAIGAERGPLGFPTMDESGTPDGVGRFNYFSNGGAIYWTPQTGAWSIHGAILAHWLAIGAERGPLGFPTMDESGTPDRVGRFNYFSNGGAIYWTPQTGAWSIHGAILGTWAALGWERSAFGYPISDEGASPDGRVSLFQAGRLDWNARTGYVTQGYGANPLRDVSNLRPERIDEGVDYAGSGPVYAIGPGVVLNLYNAGWPGGTYISYRLTSGPRVGMVVYVAENVIPTVSIGQYVDTSTVVGILIDAYPNMEIGWSDPAGTGNALAYTNGHLVYPSPEGLDFTQFLISLGAPGGSRTVRLMRPWGRRGPS